MTQNKRPLDLIAIGRAGVDLYSEQINGPLEDTQSFKKYVGGSPCNVTIGAARLKLKTAMITKVGDDALGRFIIQTLKDEGVNTHFVDSCPDRLTGLVVLGIEDKDTFPLIFYRENCADMFITENQIDKDYIASSQALLLSGTHLSSAQSFKVSALAAKYAQDVGTQVILDIDYRPTLWGLARKGDGQTRYIASQDVTSTIQAILPTVDLVVGTEEEIHIAGGSSNTTTALQNIANITKAPIVVKRGKHGASFFRDKASTPIHVQGFDVNVMNVLGAGDAFLSGFLKGWLNKQSIEKCLTLGNACGAIVVSRHGCAPAMPTLMELEMYTSMLKPPLTPDDNHLINHTHWALTQKTVQTPLMIAAFDCLLNFEALAKKTRVSLDIKKAKQLVATAMLHVNVAQGTHGVIIDDKHDSDYIPALSDNVGWLARSVEKHGEKPLSFEQDLHLYKTLQSWPTNHCVKCLVNLHPDDLYAVTHQQETQLRHLYNTCRDTGHALILQLEVDGAKPITPKTFAQIIERIYDLNIFPDWWLLPSQRESSWQHIENIIDQFDPLCRGIILYTGSSTVEQIRLAIEHSANNKFLKGFAIGAALYAEPLKLWASSKINDDKCIELIVNNFMQALAVWMSHTQSVGSL